MDRKKIQLKDLEFALRRARRVFEPEILQSLSDPTEAQNLTPKRPLLKRRPSFEVQVLAEESEIAQEIARKAHESAAEWQTETENWQVKLELSKMRLR